MFFKCKHPFDNLLVLHQETVTKVDDDFEHVVYHFECINCRKCISIGYTRLIIGVKSYLSLNKKKEK